EMGTCLGWNADELATLRRTALVHDIGKVALPVGILTRRASLSEGEEETYRLHPYYTQRILERVEAFHDLASAAASHHEWVNGQGYYRQLRGEQIPLHGRVLAVANAYARHLQRQSEPKNPAEILRMMLPEVGSQFDAECYQALVVTLKGKDEKRVVAHLPMGSHLTARENEVLRLLAQGHNTPQIAKTLAISKKTVEHHLAHIYAKIGVTCRTAAVVYAVQQKLV
ncbi:MAG TPA: HD domain-containing phosphohydrolase, partial [Ktedonobacteraceae bacterium]|nr:HD domain-containing phosphohydrolase [Ktedonobacteraceae bacterium]